MSAGGDGERRDARRGAVKLLFAALAVCALAAGCERKGGERTPPGGETGAADMLMVTGRLIPDLLERGELKAVRGRGILRVRLACGRAPFCFKDGHGIPAGFEVDLAGRIAAVLNVKLNVVEDDGAGADIESARAGTTAAKAAAPYYFAPPDAYLHFRVVSGDDALAQASARVIRHLYETGAYQQIYANWFAAGGEPGGAPP
ncbi:MAG: hypothetical protein AB1742_09850 [bacterium]